MKKTALALVGLASSAATASAAPRLAAQERASARETTKAAPSPADDFDAWLEMSYGTSTTDQAARLLDDAARTIGDMRVLATRLLAPAVVTKKDPTRRERAPITYPRVDGRGDIVCANVATKGGSKRECHDRSGMWVSPDSIALDDL